MHELALAITFARCKASSLGQLSVEQFMALSSSEEAADESSRKNKTPRKRKRTSSSARKVTPTLPRAPTEHDDPEPDWQESEESGTEEGMGVVEPRPLEVTSWKEKIGMVSIC